MKRWAERNIDKQGWYIILTWAVGTFGKCHAHKGLVVCKNRHLSAAGSGLIWKSEHEWNDAESNHHFKILLPISILQ